MKSYNIAIKKAMKKIREDICNFGNNNYMSFTRF